VEDGLEVSIDLVSVVEAHCRKKGIEGVDAAAALFHKKNVAVSIKVSWQPVSMCSHSRPSL
jgi:hypothetical protein